MTNVIRFLRLADVEHLVGLRKSAIYSRIERGDFPKPVALGDKPNSPVGWVEAEIATWQQSRLSKRTG